MLWSNEAQIHIKSDLRVYTIQCYHLDQYNENYHKSNLYVASISNSI